MPRHHQRQLRVGTALRCVSGSLIVLSVASTTAIAEVCDKIAGEHWRSPDGVVLGKTSTIDWSWGAPMALLLLAVAAVLAAIPVILKSLRASERISFVVSVYLKWFTYAATAAVTLVVAFVLYSFIVPDDILLGGVSEGCVSLTTDWKPVGVAAFVVALYGWAALRLRRFERVAEAQYRGLVAG